MRADAPPARRVAFAVMGVGLVLFVVVAVVRVPWHPYPGGPLDPPPAESVFTHAQISAMESYSSFARFWSRSGMVISLLVACVLGFSPLGRRLMGLLRGPWWLRVVQGVVVLEVLGSLATLVPAIQVRRRQLEVGLSRQAWSGFATDRLTSLVVSIVATSLGLLALMACVRRWRRFWPAIAGVTLGVLVLLGSYVYPVIVEPLFNNFTSLPAGELRSDVFALAEKQGVHIDDVLVADASRRTTTLNAYVSGFGSTRRVVLFDNLVNEVPRAETLSVVSHELGHAKHDDVLTGSLLGATGALAAIGLLGVIVERRRADGSRIGEPEDVPMLLALLAIGTVLALPLQNTISRQIETRADVAALETTKDADAFVNLQRKLALSSLSDPTPASWSQFWFGSHPTALQRIALAKRLGS
ncbi:M48 family metallopeptidase [Nocardioides sp. CER19]|uniref:M48 family metallopeptidase n=1 Tax=Nocardioides sp. CER19 TaxID=3038538 RepID=UPI00244D0DE0|nr:M48 family metallopeptidase [Nocardioides sp. CER19]MDH2416761.1 M48 family metallopeptidase [Nocardioides sp. CER19]